MDARRAPANAVRTELVCTRRGRRRLMPDAGRRAARTIFRRKKTGATNPLTHTVVRILDTCALRSLLLLSRPSYSPPGACRKSFSSVLGYEKRKTRAASQAQKPESRYSSALTRCCLPCRFDFFSLFFVAVICFRYKNDPFAAPADLRHGLAGGASMGHGSQGSGGGGGGAAGGGGVEGRQAHTKSKKQKQNQKNL